jgi:hypothetical protein
MSKSTGLQIRDRLLDDRIGAMGLLSLEHGQRGVELVNPMVPVSGEQLTLPVQDGPGIQAPDPTHDQPATAGTKSISIRGRVGV